MPEKSRNMKERIGELANSLNLAINVKNDVEPSYRQFYLKNDRNVARAIIFLSCLVIAIFTVSDSLFFELSFVFFVTVAIRIILILSSLVAASYIANLNNFETFDKVCLSLMIILSAGILAVYIAVPETILSQILIIDIAVLTIYLVVPTRFTYQIIPASILSIGGTLLLIMFYPTNSIDVLAPVFSIFFANLFGAFISAQLHFYRWKVFRDYKAFKESERLIAIGQTAGMVGHDIRNPLQAMNSDIYLMKEEIASIPASKMKEELVESLDGLEQNIVYINKIVSDLQDYSKQITPEYSKTNLSDIITRVIGTRLPDSIKLSIKIKDMERLQTDPMLLQRALSNLVTNAIQAMPDGGVLEITCYHQGNNTFITVSDTGAGISEEIKPKLFTPMTTTKAKGQGFGLAVSKRIIEALKGTISFESEEGKGTKFIIELPNAQ